MPGRQGNVDGHEKGSSCLLNHSRAAPLFFQHPCLPLLTHNFKLIHPHAHSFIPSLLPSHPREKASKPAAGGGSLPNVSVEPRARPLETTFPTKPRDRRNLRLAHSRSSRPARAAASLPSSRFGQRETVPKPPATGARAPARLTALTSGPRRGPAASAGRLGLRLFPISCLTAPLSRGGRAQPPCCRRRRKIAGDYRDWTSPRRASPRRRSRPCAPRSQASREM